jgi:hypothetical protein
MKWWFVTVSLTIVLGVSAALILIQKQRYLASTARLAQVSSGLQSKLDQVTRDFDNYKQTDQVTLNQQLIADLAAIKKSYQQSLVDYELIVDLKNSPKQFQKIDSLFAQTLSQLSLANYASASSTLKILESEISKETARLASTPPPSKPASSQVVKTTLGDFNVNVISADLKTTKVLVDTASDSDCADNCPILPLSTYVQRSGAFAGINGPYSCPASYPACAGKKNTFDTLIMNKNKHYFNSDNNVYSIVPAAIFTTTSRFVAKSLEWGRDTSVDSVIAGQPLLVFNGQSQFSGDGDPKKSSKGPRPFIGATDSTVYIGIVYNASVAESAVVIAAMGIKNAINLDGGGSVSMWQNGKYVAGPGRDLPFGIVLVKR